MVLTPLSFLSALGAPLLLGAAVLGALGIRPRTDRLAYPGWAWMTGALGTALIVFAWLWARPDTGSARVPAALVLLAALLVHLVGRRARVEAVPPFSPIDGRRWEVWLFRAVLVLVLVLTAERILEASLHPIVATDEGNFWAYRAKILFHSRGFGPQYAADVRTYGLLNADYPLLNPLLQLWIFAHAGEITDAVNRLPIQLYSVALVLVLAGGLRRVARPGVAALLLLLYPAMTDARSAVRLAYSDVIVAFGLLVALDAWLRWRADRRTAWVGLGSLAATTMLWSKHEGALIACAMLLALVLERFVFARRESLRVEPARARLWLLPPAAVVLITWGVNALYGASNLFMERRSTAGPGGRDLEGNFLTQFVAQLDERLVPVLRYFLEKILLAPRHSELLLLCFLGLCLAAPRTLWRGALRLPGLILVLSFSGFALVFVGLPKDLDYHLSTAAGRIVFQVVPGAMLWIGAASSLLLAGTRPSILYTVLVALLAWRGAVSLPAAARELAEDGPAAVRGAFTLSREERIAAELDRLQADREFEPGVYRAIYRAIVDNVPADGLVYVLITRRDPDRTIAKTWRLTFPRRFVFSHPPRDVIEAKELGRFEPGFWIIDLAGVPELLEGAFTRVAGGNGWSLWH